jgi:2-amino-4-hydroxy-6-hydroxymethyldihydropteridine diphosphokinase
LDLGAQEVTAYFALGSNLGDRLGFLVQATRALRDAGLAVEGCSAVYETDAVAASPQPPYLNAALRARTGKRAAETLAIALGIEAGLGRVRPRDSNDPAPRTLDIDLLLYGSAVLAEPGLLIPHPRLLARSFVRVPLADVAVRGLRHPVDQTPLDVASPDPGVRLLLSAGAFAALALPAGNASV